MSSLADVAFVCERLPMDPAFDEGSYARIFGLRKKSDRDFAEGLVQALQKIDPALLPPPTSTPLSPELSTAGIPHLLFQVENQRGQSRDAALEALAHVLFDTPADAATISALRGLLAASTEPGLSAELAKTLAIAQDPIFLQEQLRRLGDPDPGVVAAAARLVGFGRYRAAVAVLKGLVSPERFVESRWAIWALGEIADPAALPTLQIALSQCFHVVDCLIAIGKIGELSSLPALTPHLVQGLPEQKDAAVRALAMLLDRHREGEVGLAVRAELAGFFERDLAESTTLWKSTRFYMLLCLARMGLKLDEARVRRYLGVTLDDNDARHIKSLVERKKTAVRLR